MDELWYIQTIKTIGYQLMKTYRKHKCISLNERSQYEETTHCISAIGHSTKGKTMNTGKVRLGGVMDTCHSVFVRTTEYKTRVNHDVNYGLWITMSVYVQF